MRDVARTAGVALGTMYRYFPSKAHLLVAVLAAQLGRFELHACRSLDDINDPYDRLRRVISMLTAEMQRAPLMTDALARGFAQASFAAGTDMDEVRDQLSEMFASLMSAYRPSSRHRDIGDLLADVWATDILGLALGTNSLDAVSFRFSRLLDLLRRNEMVPRGDEQRDV
jgi:AcrR family transcriptional regulator